MNTDLQPANPRDVSRIFRLNARHLRDSGGAAVEGLAWVWERAATIVDLALNAEDDERLSLTRAARESGKSVDHLGRLIREGKVSNAGRKGKPLVRRGDLRRVCGVLPSAPRRCDIGREAIARAVVSLHAGDN